MKRRAPDNTGFILSFLINFAFRSEWGVLLVILLVVRIFWKFPLFIVFIPLVLWVLHALLVTVVFSQIARLASGPYEERPNINPYSRRDSAGRKGAPRDAAAAEAIENSAKMSRDAAGAADAVADAYESSRAIPAEFSIGLTDSAKASHTEKRYQEAASAEDPVKDSGKASAEDPVKD